MTYRDRQQQRALAAQARRIVALEALVATLRERLDSTSSSLSLAWRKLEALERRLGPRPAPRLAAAAPAPAPPPARETRLPLARAAKLLGVSRDHCLRLARDGLDLADLRERGADRALWTVSQARVEALLAARRARPAAPPDADSPETLPAARR